MSCRFHLAPPSCSDARLSVRSPCICPPFRDAVSTFFLIPSPFSGTCERSPQLVVPGVNSLPHRRRADSALVRRHTEPDGSHSLPYQEQVFVF
jgi:hypothetical protein